MGCRLGSCHSHVDSHLHILGAGTSEDLPSITKDVVVVEPHKLIDGTMAHAKSSQVHRQGCADENMVVAISQFASGFMQVGTPWTCSAA